MNDLTGMTLAQRFQVVQFVGRGGMADVYKVWDIQRSVYLAIKVLKEDLAEDEIFLRRFRREAETLSKLQHPFIIRSYGLVQADDLAFLVMDFIEGSTLRKQIFNHKAPWPPEMLIAAMRPVCAALNFAHTQDLVHCDVKPANIMITATGDVLLADFGIARVTESATTATMVGAGTPAYMAPEQIRGEDPLPQTDVYALGIILFELLTGGERPFTGEHAQTTGSSSEKVRWEQIHRIPPSPRVYNPDIPANVEAIVLKCLEKDPQARFSSTMELESALEQAYPNVNVSQKPAWSIPVPPPSAYPPVPGGNPQQPTYAPATPPLPSAFSNQSVGQARRKLPVPIWMILIGLGVIVFVAAFALSSPPADPTVVPQITGNSASIGVGASDPSSKSPGVTPGSPTTAPIIQGPAATLTPVPSPTTRPLPTIILTPTSEGVNAPACTARGQTWIRPTDHATMVCVPTGSFSMGFPNCKEIWCQNEASQGSVMVDAFWMDQYEITNAQFQQFVSDTGFVTGAERSGASEVFGNLQPVSGANWRSPQGPGSSISRKEDHPVVQINWFGANSYCQWAGGQLPSEAEWEMAARGTDGRLFPWGGDMPASRYLNAAGESDGFQYTAPVGSFSAGQSPFGLFDMAGNAFEWTRSKMKSYPYVSTDGREITSDPGLNDKVVSRGGSFYTDYGTVRSTWRAEVIAQFSTDGTGFRCVVDR